MRLSQSATRFVLMVSSTLLLSQAERSQSSTFLFICHFFLLTLLPLFFCFFGNHFFVDIFDFRMLGRQCSQIKQCGTVAARALQIRASSNVGFNVGTFYSKYISIETCIDFSPEQIQLRDSVRKFVADEIIPKAAEYDKTMEYPWDIIKKAHEIGFLNAEIPAEYGGLELDAVSNTIIAEEVAYGCSGRRLNNGIWYCTRLGIATAMTGNHLAETPLMVAGNDEVKKRFLPRMVEQPLVAVRIAYMLYY